VRGKNNGTWQAWRKILDSSNYTDYTVTKDGTGATGTWGISISGTADEAKWLMNRGTNVTIADSTWAHNQKGRGDVNTANGTVWK
jgi:hypothetical protein